MSLLSEFKQFALRGNVVDMAVGVIIGGAFSKIVSSLVSDVLMPPVGMINSVGNFKDAYIALFDVPKALAEGKIDSTPTLEELRKANLPVFAYGSFVSTVIDFVILAICVFVMVKIMNTVFRRHEAAPKPAETPPQEKLLTEIRDLLKVQG